MIFFRTPPASWPRQARSRLDIMPLGCCGRGSLSSAAGTEQIIMALAEGVICQKMRSTPSTSIFHWHCYCLRHDNRDAFHVIRDANGLFICCGGSLEILRCHSRLSYGGAGATSARVVMATGCALTKKSPVTRRPSVQDDRRPSPSKSLAFNALKGAICGKLI